MGKSLRTHLKEFIERRVEEAAIRAGRNKKAQKITISIMELQDLILLKMPIEDGGLLLKYEEALSDKEVIIYERIYWQGLNDGIKIANKSKDITKL
jgi:hypothetical protein